MFLKNLERNGFLRPYYTVMKNAKVPSKNNINDPLPTRQSLLDRLKDGNDQDSWRIFCETYWQLIYQTALKAGLTEQEAEEVVQETTLAAWKSMPTFQYDTHKGSFKGWLLRLTGWRIVDELRKREKGMACRKGGTGTSTRTATIERVADPAGPELELVWDQEWKTNLLNVALDRVKKRADAKQYQIYDLHVLQGLPVLKVARVLGINAARVYLAKHRIGRMVTKEIALLEAKPL